jgi:predicted AAA+ superfamily ATPase
MAKFRKSAVHVRKGNRKYYLVDLALRNAVMRLSEEEILNDESVLGLYAENLVFNALKKWRGILQVDYYRNRNYEIDFIVHTGPTRYWPVEVKYRKSWGYSEVAKSLDHFSTKYNCHMPAVVTMRMSDFGQDSNKKFFRFPLVLFLLLFDE